MESIIKVEGLSKKFKNITAVNDLSFSIQKGDIYGFLGQNGAGKSTTIRMLLGLIHPTSGSVLINGVRLDRNKKASLKLVGAVVERPDLYKYLSAWDNIKMFAKLSKKNISKERMEEVIEIVGLTGREGDKVKTYSQGMKQRLGIAIAMLHDPEVLILDEPTNGLDPQGIADIRELIRTLGTQHGKTVLVSSHLLHEIEQIANKMIIIHKGEKIAEGSVKELLNPNDTLMEVDILPDDKLTEEIKKSEWGEFYQEGNSNKLFFKMHPRKMPRLNKFLVEKDVHVLEIKSKHSLESYFLSLTNQADVEAGAV